MAKIISLAEKNKIPRSEYSVLDSVERLDDSWTILHSVAWQSLRNGRQGDGEADFVILHPRYGLMVLEVKGGGITVKEGKWHSTNQEGTFAIKDPFKQAVDSKHALLSFIRECCPWFAQHGRICHGVVFPDIRMSDRLALLSPTEVVIDADGLRAIERKLISIADYWDNFSDLSGPQVQLLTAKLAPTRTVRTMLSVRARSVSDALVHLTYEQTFALNGLARNRRALLLGSAGSGKTLLAIEKAKRLGSDLFSVLLVCYNELLAKELASQLMEYPNIKVATFHSLVMELAAKSRIKFPKNPTELWWKEDAPVMLIDVANATGYTPDAVLIDEAQDFEFDWIDALIAITKDPENTVCFTFADNRQDFYGRLWDVPIGWAQFELTRNCRNSLPIARAVAAVLEDPSPSSGPDGPEPVFHPTNFRTVGMATIQSWAEELMETEGFSPSEIVVLTDSARTAERLCELTAGPIPFCRFGQVGIVVETIRRFKGLEADAVLLVWSEDSKRMNQRELAYVGLSRARSVLHIFAPPSERAAFGF